MADYGLYTIQPKNTQSKELWLPSSVGFGPGEPLRPAAPGERPRANDYAVSRNIQVAPRAAESRAVTYDQMRALARTYGILRTVIEQRKDELKGLDWQIAVKKEYANQGYEDEARKTQRFFDKPDLENTFDQWLGMLAEDIFVVDTPALYKERDRIGRFRCLRVMDGTKILVLTDDTGRVPNPPQMAYEQIIKGMPRTSYCKPCRDERYLPDEHNNLYELYYRPYNTASDGVYGFSHVESIIMTINIALRRDASFMEWFRSGNVPQGIVQFTESTMANMTPEQLKQWQEMLDTLLSGDLAQRSKIHVLPGVGGVEMLQQLQFDGLFDEWLARVVCARFGVSPAPYVRMMNRASAQTQEESRQEYALIPMLQHFKVWFDQIICDDLGQPYLEFIWTPGANYGKEKADMNNTALEHGVKTIDAVRGEQGQEPLPDGIGAEPLVWTGSGPIRLRDIISGAYQASQATTMGQSQGLPALSTRLQGQQPSFTDEADDEPIYPELSINAELDDWEKFTLNRLGKKALRNFEAKVIPPHISQKISEQLAAATTPEAVKAVFSDARQGLGRRNRTPAVEGSLNQLIGSYEGVLKAAMQKAKAAVEVA